MFFTLQFILVLDLVAFRTGLVQCAPGVILPFGTGKGDTFLRKADEYNHDVIQLDHNFTFLDREYNNVFINTNGLLSFKNPFPSFSTDTLPVPGPPFVAPYWADVDTRDFGAISFRQVSWSGSEDAILNAVNEIVRGAFIDQQDFIASWIMMVSWNKVGFNSQIDSTRVNTFQCILVSDGQFSGVIFNYGTLLWTSDIFHGGNHFTGLGGIPAQIGFNAGDGIHSYRVEGSQTEEVINMTMRSNVGVPGRFVYRVDLPEIRDPQCKAEGDVQLYPATDTMLGGTKIFLQGPCFDPVTSSIVCRFGDSISVGIVESSTMKASCVSPMLLKAGDVPVLVSLDGGVTFPFTGYLQVQTPQFPMVFKVEEGEWLTSRNLELMWDWQALDGVTTVDIVVYSYWESPDDGQMHWEIIETLASGVAYSDGGLNFVKPHGRKISGDGSGLMGAIGVVEEIAEAGDRIPRAIWSDVDSLQWLFPQNAASWCAEWSNSERILDRLNFSKSHTPCPCVLRQAKRDFGRYRLRQDCRDDAWGKFPGNCDERPGAFHCVVALSYGQNGDQECCYDRSGTLIEDRFAASGFGLSRHCREQKQPTHATPFDVPYFSHFFHDVIPEMQCCKFSTSGVAFEGSDSSCDSYRANRPSQSCRFYEVPRPAGIFGASHVETFDGLKYTFPAKGEYVLLQTSNNDFTIQGRFEQIETGDEALSSIMTAVAIKQRGRDVIHIQSSPRRLHVDVYVQRENGSFSLIDPVLSHSWSFKGVNLFYSDWDNVQLSFGQGVGLLVKSTGESLRCVVIAPPEFQNRTDGLLGSWNGDKEDDLRLEDGMYLSGGSIDEDVLNSLRAKWSIKDGDESLFHYFPGYSRDIYFNAEQPHISFDREPEIEPIAICGGDTLCAHDLIVSANNKGFAGATLSAQAQLQEIRDDLAEVDKSFLLCPELANPTNGNIYEPTGRYFGDIATFYCNDCYELIGNATLSCNYDLRWSDTLPVCKREVNTTCTEPVRPGNGTFYLSQCNRTVTFSCNEGYILIGEELVTCVNGSWNDDPPVCAVYEETSSTTEPSTTTMTTQITESIGGEEPRNFTKTPENNSAIIEAPIAGQRRTDSDFLVWWILVTFISIIIVALIAVAVFLCYGLKSSSKKRVSSGKQYNLVAST